MRKRPFLWLAVAFGIGIVLAEAMTIGTAIIGMTAAGCACAAGVCRRSGWHQSIFILVAFLALGAWRTGMVQILPDDDISRVARYYRKQPVAIEGLVASGVEARKFFRADKTVFTLAVQRMETRWGWKPKHGRVLVQLFRREDIRYGDVLRLTGKLHPPFEFDRQRPANEPGRPFSYRAYLRRKGIRYLCSVKKNGPVMTLARGRGHPVRRLALGMKRRFAHVLQTHLTPGAAGLMRAILLGERYHVPAHIRNLFERTGTAHVLAISGLHIGIMAAVMFVLLRLLPLPRWGPYVLTTGWLLFYAVLVGARVSVVRAVIMAVVFLLKALAEREHDGLNSLGLAGLLILVIQPMALHDIGFQFSFISVASILLWLPVMQSLGRVWSRRYGVDAAIIDRARPLRAVVQGAMVSLSAWTGVAGLIAWYFGIVTPIAVAANLVVVPLITAVVTLGVGLLLTGMVLPAGAHLFGVCLQGLLNLTVALIYGISHCPGAWFYVSSVPWPVIASYYILLCGALVAGCLFRRKISD